MQAPGTASLHLFGQELELHPLKAVYWQEERTLLLADLHLGKTRHFRKAGIATPKGVEDTNFDRLISLLLIYQPKRVLLLGDLFHSDYNLAWEGFSDLLAQFASIDFALVPGNHDILDKEHYGSAGLRLEAAKFVDGPFLFTHEPEAGASGLYNIAGHIHPGVRLEGPARQSMRLPCFYFGQDNGILPAFGAFTGLATIQPRLGDRVYGIAHDEVIFLTDN